VNSTAAIDLAMIDPGVWADMEPPDRQWALADWIPDRQATYLTGAGSTGKSLLSQQLATCLALGRNFLGVPIDQRNAIYITCEDDGDELHRRQKAINGMMRAPVALLSGRLHLLSRAGEPNNELCRIGDDGTVRPTALFEAIEAAAKETSSRFVVLDNVAHLFAGNENIRHDVAAFVALLNRLAMRINGAVLLIGHPNKAGDSFSGSTAWENQVRSRLFLEQPRDDDGDTVDPDMRELSRAKANYARTGDVIAFRWHQWAFVRDSDLPANVHAEIEALARENRADDCFVQCLTKATEEKRATSPSKSATNYAPRLFALMPSSKGIGEKSLEAAMQRLLHQGKIINGQRVYQRDNRAWVTGLGFAPTLAPTLAPSLAPSRTDQPANPHESCTNLHALTPLYTTYKGQADADLSSATLFDADYRDWEGSL